MVAAIARGGDPNGKERRQEEVLNRRSFLASLAAVATAPVMVALAPPSPITPQGLVFHRDAFALTMAPLDAEPFSILDFHQRYFAPAAKAMADEIGADIMKRFTRSR